MSPLSACAVLALVLQAPASTPASLPTARAVVMAADGAETRVPLGEFEVPDPASFRAALVRFEGGPAPAAPAADAATVELAGGERFLGALTGGGGERFELRLAEGLVLPVDLERLQALRFESRLVGAVGVEPAAEGDRIYRAQAGGVERIDGAVEGFSEAGVRFHGELVGTIAIPWRSVAALFIEPLGAAPDAPAAGTVPVVLDLADGSRVRGALRGVRGRAVDFERQGAVLRIPLQAVLQIARDDGSLAFLASLPPVEDGSSRPFGDDLGMVWRARTDRSVDGGPLRAGGVRHPRGLGVHAPSRVAWKLDGSQARLSGAVAVDDEVQRLATRGSCVFRVLLDGREAFVSPVLRAGDAPVPFTLDVLGARELALVADPTSDGFAGDRANWLGLVLLRAQSR
ncbi:MAG: NPCBM/NEW2 domain-containing protein [Planctomycetes bacterium]|nr:NPCBM/NEW2 domain-containing protein [Planctomycetota bacterium]